MLTSLPCLIVGGIITLGVRGGGGEEGDTGHNVFKSVCVWRGGVIINWN